MFKALLLIFLGGEGLSSRKSRDKLYDMQCACGLRVNDEISEKHCKESALLEDSNQASNKMINFNCTFVKHVSNSVVQRESL